MRILMIAPQPVFSPRGTPISILNRCRTLVALGHDVDLVTYPIGDDVSIPGLRFLRGPQIPGIRTVKIGPSLAKLPLDVSVFTRSLFHLMRRRYDVIHTNEEGGVFGSLLRRPFRVRHVYEMHSDLAVVMTNYGLAAKHPLVRLAGWLERRAVRSADSVVAHFPGQLPVIARWSPATPATLISDTTIETAPDDDDIARVRQKMAPDGEPLVVYAGTLEPYQGIPLLLEAMSKVTGTNARLLVVGGRPDQVVAVRERAAELGIADRVILTGLRPAAEIPAYLRAASVLVSPRNRGNNAPLKLLSYMASGTPMVVTDIPSHTQLVDEETAVIVPSNADGIAAGIDAVLSAPAHGRRLADRARERFNDRYTLRSFVESTVRAYAPVEGKGDESARIDRALQVLQREPVPHGVTS